MHQCSSIINTVIVLARYIGPVEADGALILENWLTINLKKVAICLFISNEFHNPDFA